MNYLNKDITIIKRIIDYCEQIENTVNRFGKSFEIFENDFVYQNACSMCILQIGELSSQLSDEFKSKNNQVPWKNIKGMRNIFAHNYGNMSVLATYETITEDIPKLKDYCKSLIGNS